MQERRVFLECGGVDESITYCAKWSRELQSLQGLASNTHVSVQIRGMYISKSMLSMHRKLGSALVGDLL